MYVQWLPSQRSTDLSAQCRSLPACEAATESEAGFQFVFGGSVCIVYADEISISSRFRSDFALTNQLSMHLSFFRPCCISSPKSFKFTSSFFLYRYMVMFIGILYMCCSPHCQVHDPGFRPPEGAWGGDRPMVLELEGRGGRNSWAIIEPLNENTMSWGILFHG